MMCRARADHLPRGASTCSAGRSHAAQSDGRQLFDGILDDAERVTAFIAVGGTSQADADRLGRCARHEKRVGHDHWDHWHDHWDHWDHWHYYDMPVSAHPLREGVRDNTNHYVTGRDIDLRKFATEGMELFGLLRNPDRENLYFEANLRKNLDDADVVYNGINASIDKYIDKQAIEAGVPEVYSPVWQPGEERSSLNLRDAGIGAIIWCIGFEPDFRWLAAPVFDGRGHPGHVRGVTAQPGLYFLGLPWLYTWGSGRFSGVARDAHYLAGRIQSHRKGGATAATAATAAGAAVVRTLTPQPG